MQFPPLILFHFSRPDFLRHSLTRYLPIKAFATDHSFQRLAEGVARIDVLSFVNKDVEELAILSFYPQIFPISHLPSRLGNIRDSAPRYASDIGPL